MTRTPASTAKPATKRAAKPKAERKATTATAKATTAKAATATAKAATTGTPKKATTGARKVAVTALPTDATSTKKAPATDGGFQQRYVSSARRALSRLETQLTQLESRAGAAAQDRFAELFRQLESSQRLAEAKLARLAPGAADWDDAATSYEQAARAFRRLLATTRIELDAEPDVGGVCVPAAIRDQLEAWEAQVDELIVQAHLAGMDLRDEIANLNLQVQEVRRSVRRIALDEPAEQAMAQVRASFRTLASGWEKVRHQLART